MLDRGSAGIIVFVLSEYPHRPCLLDMVDRGATRTDVAKTQLPYGHDGVFVLRPRSGSMELVMHRALAMDAFTAGKAL